MKRCLDRDVKRRLRDIGEARIAIDRAIAEPHAGDVTTAGSRGFAWAIALALAIGTAGILLTWRVSRSVSPPATMMVASYSVDGDTFRADQPRLWSPGRFLVRPRLTSYDLHPDGDRFAPAAVSGVADLKQHNVVFIFNVFDELRRVAPASR